VGLPPVMGFKPITLMSASRWKMDAFTKSILRYTLLFRNVSPGPDNSTSMHWCNRLVPLVNGKRSASERDQLKLVSDLEPLLVTLMLGTSVPPGIELQSVLRSDTWFQSG